MLSRLNLFKRIKILENCVNTLEDKIDYDDRYGMCRDTGNPKGINQRLTELETEIKTINMNLGDK